MPKPAPSRKRRRKLFRSFFSRLQRARDGVAAVEFAIIAPLLAVLLMGIVAYGGYFWIAHTVQQLANDSARAAIAGLTDEEREALARAWVEREADDLAPLTRAQTLVRVGRTGAALTVAVDYDASGSVFWALSVLIPMPPETVSRAATIRVGGL